MKLYVAGPMRGYERNNFPAFDAEAARLRELGHEVISPADLDRQTGFDEHLTVMPEGFMRKAFDRDVAALKVVDGIVVLPGWQKSTGALAEAGIARWLGLPIYEAGTMREVGGKLGWNVV